MVLLITLFSVNSVRKMHGNPKMPRWHFWNFPWKQIMINYFFDIIGRCCRSGREYTSRITYINYWINQNGAYLVFDLPWFIHTKISSQTRWQHFTSISNLQISFSSLQTTASTPAPTKSTTTARCWNTFSFYQTKNCKSIKLHGLSFCQKCTAMLRSVRPAENWRVLINMP